jgi:excisionase family DNA binding protein
MFEKYPDIVTIQNLMEMLHIGKSSAYSLLQQNKIKHVRVGKKYVIPKQSVVGFVNDFCYNGDKIITVGSSVKKGEVDYGKAIA